MARLDERNWGLEWLAKREIAKDPTLESRDERLDRGLPYRFAANRAWTQMEAEIRPGIESPSLAAKPCIAQTQLPAANQPCSDSSVVLDGGVLLINVRKQPGLCRPVQPRSLIRSRDL